MTCAAGLRSARTLACAALLLAACGRGDAVARPDVVIVTWDTARADHVGPDAAVVGLTPRWSALAEEGVRFSTARTPSPSTLPAHASLLTGASPPRHGARENGLFALPDAAQTLAERLGAAGWRTGAFVSAAVLDAGFGLAQGFSHYDDRVSEAREREFAERRADATVDAALAWVAQVPPAEPVFVWVHLFDPHTPWSAPERFASQHPQHPYRAEIAWTDAETGRLLDGLRASGRLDRSLVVLTADHGEGLGEHGERTHGFFLYDSTVRVPLAWWAGPASGLELARGRRVDAPVLLSDVAPTLADLLGQGVAWPGDGASLRAWLEGGEAPPRDLALETVDAYYVLGAAPLFGVVDRAGDVWIDAPRRELYRLAQDPAQLENRYADARRAEADALFGRHPRAWPAQEPAPALSSETHAQLEALGYLAARVASPAAADGAARPDPKDLLPVAALWMGDRDGETPLAALARAEALVARFGPLPALAFFRADRLVELARPDEAIEALREAHERYPEETRLERELEDALLQRAQDRDLAARIRATLAAQPDHPGAVHDLAVVLHRLGDLEGAERAYRDWLAAHPDDAATRLELFRLLGARRDYDGALALAHEAPAAARSPALACAEGRLLAWWLERTDAARAPLRACRDAGEPLSARELALVEGA